MNGTGLKITPQELNTVSLMGLKRMLDTAHTALRSAQADADFIARYLSADNIILGMSLNIVQMWADVITALDTTLIKRIKEYGASTYEEAVAIVTGAPLRYGDPEP